MQTALGKKNMVKINFDFSDHLTSHNQIWRIVLGLLSIFVIYGTTISTFFYGLEYLGFNAKLVVQGSSPENLALLLLSFFPIWVGLAIVNKVIHKRPLQALYGSSYSINWRHFKTGAIFLITILAIGEILLQIYFAVTGTPSYSANMIMNLRIWVLWLLPMSAALLIQIGAEELVFRGYLLQTIRARGGNIFWAAVVPSFLFGLGHFDPETYGINAYFYVLHTTVLGIILCLVTLRLGNLGAALGIHFANNALSCFVLGVSGELNGMALFDWQIDQKSPLITLSMIVYVVLMVVIYNIWTRKYFTSQT